MSRLTFKIITVHGKDGLREATVEAVRTFDHRGETWVIHRSHVPEFFGEGWKVSHVGCGLGVSATLYDTPDEAEAAARTALDALTDERFATGLAAGRKKDRQTVLS